MTDELLKQAASFIGWNTGEWKIDEGNGYPHFVWEDVPGIPIITDYPTRTYSGNGSETDPYQLKTAEDLVCLSLREPDWNQFFVLVNDIDMSGVTGYRPISLFSGRMNGQGYAILESDDQRQSLVVVLNWD